MDLPFEDTKLMVPVGYEHVLEWIYGDYMTLPPVEMRSSTTTTFLALLQAPSIWF